MNEKRGMGASWLCSDWNRDIAYGAVIFDCSPQHDLT